VVNTSLLGLQGNGIDVAPLVQYEAGVRTFTRADYGRQFTASVNLTSAPHPPSRMRAHHLPTQPAASVQSPAATLPPRGTSLWPEGSAI
jgi:hypothetical protein